MRELGVYSEIWPCDTPLEKIRAANPIGVIFTGGPDNVYAPDAPACDRGVFELGVPVLGICYGMQFMCHSLGGQVSPCDKSEYALSIGQNFRYKVSILQCFGLFLCLCQSGNPFCQIIPLRFFKRWTKCRSAYCQT